MVIMQGNRPEPAVIAWPQQPVRRPTKHPFFIQVLKEPPRHATDDCLGLGGQSFVDDPSAVARACNAGGEVGPRPLRMRRRSA
jgi:hypothetical protein